ncbi:MAG: hypothetical protein JNK35_10040 [Phycisphaerae bacterium]|nr:hypothetical protein [Phycisphaerae bacterium]
MSHSVAPRPIDFTVRPWVAACEVAIAWMIAGGRSPLDVRVTLAQAPEPPTHGENVLRVLSARATLGGDELLRVSGPALADAACRQGLHGLWHVDVPGVLSATLRGSPSRTARLLYACSPLLADLRAGGRIERPELTIAAG